MRLLLACYIISRPVIVNLEVRKIPYPIWDLRVTSFLVPQGIIDLVHIDNALLLLDMCLRNIQCLK